MAWNAGSAGSPRAGGRRTARGAEFEPSPVFVATWPFGQPAVEKAMRVFDGGADLLDAVEQGIGIAEDDVANASVGVGGTPNAEGVVQLDACIMEGKEQRAGAVAALEGCAHPISVARRVMEKTPHVLLVGDGARRFAIDEGFAQVDLLTDERRAAWRAWKAENERRNADRGPARRQPQSPPTHDTIALLACVPGKHLVGGCSTSGWAYKRPGRVGDSPIVGAGLYVDDEVGAAGATGLGEQILRFGGALRIVDAMRRGASPAEACEEIVRHILRRSGGTHDPNVNFLAVHRDGRYAAAGTDASFRMAIATRDGSRLEKPAHFSAP